MSKIEFYQKPTCTTCRKVKAELESCGESYESINYYEKPLSKSALKVLLTKLKARPADLLRKKETVYKELKLSSREVSEDELLDLMVKYPDLIERPIVVKGSRAVLARPFEKVRELWS